MGRLVATPELRTVGADNVAVTTLRLAVSRDYKSEGEEYAKSDFFDVEVWRESAERACKYLDKGSLVIAEGRLQQDQWEDEDGNNRSTYKLNCRNWYFAESKKADAE